MCTICKGHIAPDLKVAWGTYYPNDLTLSKMGFPAGFKIQWYACPPCELAHYDKNC